MFCSFRPYKLKWTTILANWTKNGPTLTLVGHEYGHYIYLDINMNREMRFNFKGKNGISRYKTTNHISNTSFLAVASPPPFSFSPSSSLISYLPSPFWVNEPNLTISMIHLPNLLQALFDIKVKKLGA